MGKKIAFGKLQLRTFPLKYFIGINFYCQVPYSYFFSFKHNPYLKIKKTDHLLHFRPISLFAKVFTPPKTPNFVTKFTSKNPLKNYHAENFRKNSIKYFPPEIITTIIFNTNSPINFLKLIQLICYYKKI